MKENGTTITMNKKQKNIVLIGFMGCGKSTVGFNLSYRLRIPMEDTDKLIERKQNRTISEIFAQDGEAYFRSLETELLKELKDSSYTRIISVGGGTPIRPENRPMLKACGTVIYLRVSPEVVYERVKEDSGRPLLQCDNPLERIRELMNARNRAYEECADMVIDTDKLSLDEVVDAIVSRLGMDTEV